MLCQKRIDFGEYCFKAPNIDNFLGRRPVRATYGSGSFKTKPAFLVILPNFTACMTNLSSENTIAKSPNAHFASSYHAGEIALLNSVDCVIFGFYGTELHVLLHRFLYEPFKGHWALLGGFVHPSESVDDAARNTVERLTGLQNVYMEQVYTFGGVLRVPTERVITTCYYALIEVEPTLSALSAEYGATWWPISQVASLDLVYDHPQMFEKSLEQLRRKVRYQPVGFELLPEKFTMLELRRLYESILGRTLDKRNFSKKILKMNLLHKLKEKQKGTSRRGAFYFRFDEKTYHELLEKGFLFEV
ncbi:MAG: NUDIX hydrolase [Spirosomaceae bacterium]|jgi:8-oxo-dGTP diphosphatase|nr:NUDIX hydrolase [Spirosomataceae bacterium]